jgi:hypothetical protein
MLTEQHGHAASLARYPRVFLLNYYDVLVHRVVSRVGGTPMPGTDFLTAHRRANEFQEEFVDSLRSHRSRLIGCRSRKLKTADLPIRPVVDGHCYARQYSKYFP